MDRAAGNTLSAGQWPVPMPLANKLGSREAVLRDPGASRFSILPPQAGPSFSDLSLCGPGWLPHPQRGKTGGREKRPKACDSRSPPLCHVLREVAAVTSSRVPPARIDHVTTATYEAVNIRVLASTAEGKGGGRMMSWVGSWVPNPQRWPRQCLNSVQVDTLLQIRRET